jgi:ubiquinol-cytochrome c reductase cytochrome b subunit
MAIAFYVVLTLSGGNDVIADKFHISLNAMTWAGRIGMLICRRWRTTRRTASAWPAAARPRGAGARRRDRHHQAPAGRRLRGDPPAAGGADDTATRTWSTPAAPVPKKMNRLGALLPTVQGFFYPIEKAAPPSVWAARPARPQSAPPPRARKSVPAAGRSSSLAILEIWGSFSSPRFQDRLICGRTSAAGRAVETA